MAFLGYLIKNNITKNTDNSFIELSSYESIPNQREELVAYRDDNTRNLTRITAAGKKSKITFSTISGMNLQNKISFQNFFNTAMVDTAQRKVSITFWDDESNVYKSGFFYIANTTFPIIEIRDNDIIYDSVKIELVEY